MDIKVASDYYEGQNKLAEALGIHESTISQWKKRDGVVPIKYALRLVAMSRGELELKLRDY